MSDKVLSLSTRELWARLFESRSVDSFLKDCEGECGLPRFSEYITGLCSARGEKPEQVIKRANIESSYGHRLFTGGRNPSRDTVLMFAFGLELDCDETQLLLKIARAAPLHPRIKRDAVIAYFLQKRKTVTDVQQALLENSLPLLGEAGNGSR